MTLENYRVNFGSKMVNCQKILGTIVVCILIETIIFKIFWVPIIGYIWPKKWNFLKVLLKMVTRV